MTLNPWMSQKETSVIIDPDGSGPLNPFLVDCQFDDSLQNVKTSLSHDVEEPVTVDGYQEPNYYSRKIRYITDVDGLSEVIERSDTCRQMIIWRCNNSRLMLRTFDLYIETYGYWVGRTNQNMFYWGGSAPGTYQCACGVSDEQPCILGMRSCNCDSGETDTADYGYITQKQYLPVMELHFGDTGTLNDNKVGQYQLGKLECYGDSILDNTVTFRKKDATLEFAPFEAGIAVDIWFQFKTSAPDGVLIHNTGDTNDTFIKIELKDGYIELSFNYNAGYRIQTLDYRANLSDDTWHTVHVERNTKQAYLRIDNFQAVFADVPSDHIPRLLELTKPLTVGATVDYENGFVGCMRGLRVNGVLVDMRGAVHNGQFTYGVQEGCVRKCASNPCFNGGVCIERYSHYTCNCTNTPFAGRFCSKEVGVHMELNYMIHYNFEKLTNYQPHTVMNVKVGFKTKKKQGILIQLRDGTEYVTLAMNNNGGVKFHLDIGYERWELNTAVFDIDFTDGRPHMVTFRRDVQKVYLQVDEFPSSSAELYPRILSSNIFQNFKQLFIGNNATSSFWNGFEGCIYHIQIDDILPLKTAFEDPRSVTFTPSENLIRETTCGFEEVTRAPEPVEVRIDPDPIDEWVPRPICGSPIPPPVEDRGGKHIEDGDLFFTFPRQDIILNENITGLLTMTCRVTSPNIDDVNYILIRQETSPDSGEFQCLAMIESKEIQTPTLYDRLNTSKTYVMNGTLNKNMTTYPYLSIGMDVLNLTCDDAKEYMCEVGYKNSSTETFETALTVGTIVAGAGCEMQEKLVADNSDDSLDTKTKVGIALGVVGGIVLVIIVVFLVCKYRRRAEGKTIDDQATTGYSASYTKNI